MTKVNQTRSLTFKKIRNKIFWSLKFMDIFRRLNWRVVELVERTNYKDKVIHIENVSYDMAITLTEIMNKRFDSYFVEEDMEDDNHTK